MKLVVTIPAFNEEKTIAQVIESVPRKIPGIQSVQVLVIDDGSTDRTTSVAKKFGATVARNNRNRGLAFTFQRGLQQALSMGADVIVNTDADNQYDQSQIPSIVKPILRNEADVVLGSRFRGFIESMPLGNRLGNQFASSVVRWLFDVRVSDAQTGFRAFSREAALRIHVWSDFTYTQETILQAAERRMRIVEVPITFKKRHGKSRLIPSLAHYALRAGLTVLKGYLNYRPLRFFGTLGLLFILAGLLTGFRVLVQFFSTGHVEPYLPTAVLSAVLTIVGFQIAVMGLLASMIRQNRLVSEEILYRSKKNGE